MIAIMLDAIHRLPHAKRTFRQGQHLFHADDSIVSMFLIEDAEARLVRRQRGGGSVTLQRAGPGSFLAEASLFARRYHCDAIAATPVSARVVPRAAMRRLFEADHGFASAWAGHLADEVRNARLRAEVLALRTVAERLDAWIAAQGPLPPKGEWRSVAQEIGTSPEALYREIARRR
jgi:CRP-like cAMP-binding protein